MFFETSANSGCDYSIMFCRMFSSCIIIHQRENSQNFQYSHQSCMPNIGGQNSDRVTCWIPPLEITNSRETKSSYTLATAAPAKWHFSGKVTAFNAMWCVCLWSGWQGNIQAGILDPMGLFLSQVTGHMSRNTSPPLLLRLREQFSFRYFPFHMAFNTVLLKLSLILVIIELRAYVVIVY